jgi:hypothetical protein
LLGALHFDTYSAKRIIILQHESTFQSFMGEPVKSIGLPTHYDLTGDPAWKEDAELWSRYDLELKERRGIKAHGGTKELLRGGLNSPQKMEY